MGDGIGGPVMDCLSGNMFRMYVTHFRKDNSEEYSKLEKIQIVKVENDTSPQTERTLEDLEQALKGKFVTCNVQYRDKKTEFYSVMYSYKILRKDSSRILFAWFWPDSQMIPDNARWSFWVARQS